MKDSIPSSTKKHITIGLFIIFFGVIGILFWASVYKINAGAVAYGEIIPAEDTVKIEHLEGGVISEIMVKEGDRVNEGQPLLKLSISTAVAQLAVLENEKAVLEALVRRLEAERDGRQYKAEIQSEVSGSIFTQIELFQVRKESLFQDIEILSQRIAQTEAEITAMKSRRTALEKILSTSGEALKMNTELYEHRYIEKRILLENQNKVAETEGELGKINAEIASAEQKIIETKFQILKIQSEWRNDLLEQLRKAYDDLSTASERLTAAQDVTLRSVIRSPVEGVVQDLRFKTIGGVIPPNGLVMEIVPLDKELLIEARVFPDDIDVVYPGLTSYVRLTAFKAREHFALQGEVARVSAGTFKDERTGDTYYKAIVRINSEELQKKQFNDVKLFPGMIATVDIVFGERTVMRYLLDPIIDSFRKAFKEQ